VFFSAFLELRVNGVELECDYGYNLGCKILHADLSSKTMVTSFTFSGTESIKRSRVWIWFDESGRVAHLPRNLFKEFPGLNELKIKNSDIPILKNNFFKPEFSKLGKLEFTHDNIKIIEEKTFRQLKDLVRIDFSTNEIRSLPAKLFQKNIQLKEIYLTNNKIKVIPPGTVKNLNQLIAVGLERNECVDQSFGCNSRGCYEELDYTELERSLQPCYENHAKSLNLLNEGENNEDTVRKNHVGY
jgi:Leucine-rich repeat (LRR) protein